jgi:uncharacterized LabA/DUF88 family protein
MSKCTNPDGTKGNKVSAAFPNRNSPAQGIGLQVNLDALNNPVFDMNVLLSVAQNYNALNNAVNQLIGYEVRWFRAVPQIRSQDVIFQEWTLFNVEDTPKCLKVVLPDGSVDFSIKGDDVYLATDLIKGSYENLYDIAIIVSGDADFIPAINLVRKNGKKVINAFFPKSSSYQLRNCCDGSINLRKALDKK